MQLENMMKTYQPRVSEERETRTYVVGDLESLSASVLYTGKLPPMGPSGCGVLPSSSGGGSGKLPALNSPVLPSVTRIGSSAKLPDIPMYYGSGGNSGGNGSGFVPASNFGIGPGIAREIPKAGNMIERIRKDDDLPSHLNYEYLVPGKKTNAGKQRFIGLVNLHIDLED